jgi:O-antigen ligase
MVGLFGNLGFEQGKVFFFFLVIAILDLVVLVYSVKSKLIFKITGIKILAFIFILTLLVTSLIGIDPRSSILGVQPYLQGFLLYSLLLNLFLICSIVKISLTEISAVYAASTFLVSLLAIKDWVSLVILKEDIATFSGRVVSTFGQPNLYSGYLLLTLPFFLFLLAKKYYFKLTFLGLVLNLIAIFISMSRTAIFLSLGLLLIYAVKFLLREKRKLLFISSLVIVFLTLVFAITFKTGLFWEETTRIQDPEWLQANSPEKRALIYPVVISFIEKKPFFGYGLETMPQVFPTYYIDIKTEGTKHPEYFSVNDLNINRAHNYSLDLLLYAGVLGFLCWCSLIFWLLRRSTCKIVLAALILYLIWIQFQIQSVAHLAFFWILAAQIDQESS